MFKSNKIWPRKSRLFFRQTDVIALFWLLALRRFFRSDDSLLRYWKISYWPSFLLFSLWPIQPFKTRTCRIQFLVSLTCKQLCTELTHAFDNTPLVARRDSYVFFALVGLVFGRIFTFITPNEWTNIVYCMRRILATAVDVASAFIRRGCFHCCRLSDILNLASG